MRFPFLPSFTRTPEPDPFTLATSFAPDVYGLTDEEDPETGETIAWNHYGDYATMHCVSDFSLLCAILADGGSVPGFLHGHRRVDPVVTPY